MSRTKNVTKAQRKNEKDVWGPLANLLTDLIEKHANELDLESLDIEDAHKKTDLSLD